MTFAHMLKYAGSEPYKPERDRDDVSPQAMEQLEQDETYQKLAEVRWLADELEMQLSASSVDVPNAVTDELFSAVADRDAPLQVMVDAYVDAWLDDYRDDGDDGDNEEVRA